MHILRRTSSTIPGMVRTEHYMEVDIQNVHKSKHIFFRTEDTLFCMDNCIYIGM